MNEIGCSMVLKLMNGCWDDWHIWLDGYLGSFINENYPKIKYLQAITCLAPPSALHAITRNTNKYYKVWLQYFHLIIKSRI